MQYITKIDEIITDKTKVLELNEKMLLKIGSSAEVCFSKELDSYVYYKKFALEEFIGEYIAKYLNLRTVENFIIKRNGTLYIATKNFVQKDREYINPSTIYYQKFTVLNSLGEIEKNKQLIDEFFKMSALDIYMRQEDRSFENYIFEKIGNSMFLAPLYDYTISFDYYNNDMPFFYYNGILFLKNLDYFSTYLNIFPNFRKYVEEVAQIDLIKFIEQIFEDNNFRINDKILENYKKEEEKSQKLLQKIL